MRRAEKSGAAKAAPLAFLGVACAVGVSSIYLNQPLLREMAATLNVAPEKVGLVAVATQVGYAAGMLTFVPLGDVFERRALMMRMFAGVAVALVLVAWAPTLPLLVAASVLVGMLASVTHIVLPIAPDLLPEAQRGRAIGTVMTGLLLGILLARTFSGWVSRIDGWRGVFIAGAALNLLFVPLLWRVLPPLPPKRPLGYGEAMRSLWTLTRTQPVLREASTIGALMYGAFSSFWTTLAFLLGTRYGLGPDAAGTFGLVGAAGVLIAPLAGRLADRRGPRTVVAVGLCVLLFAFAGLWGAVVVPGSRLTHLLLLVVGVIVMDGGVQMTQIGNQTRIFGIDPGARSRINTVYMTIYFSGAALGSWLSSLLWARFGWNGVMAVALGFIGLAGIRHMAGRPEADQDTAVA